MMKTYTFAPANAPVQEHMAGLVRALKLWCDAATRERDAARGSHARLRLSGAVRTYAEIIAVIEDSNSI